MGIGLEGLGCEPVPLRPEGILALGLLLPPPPPLQFLDGDLQVDRPGRDVDLHRVAGS